MTRRFVIFFGLFAAIFAAVGALSLPNTALALGLPFGGRIISIDYCVNGAIAVRISSGNPTEDVTPYIWVPGTLTFLWGPPTHIGQSIMGIADVPYVCVGPGSDPWEIEGERMQIEGTSLI